MGKKFIETSGKPKVTSWILDKREIDQLDRNKEPVICGFADSGFLTSKFKSTSFRI